MGIEPRYDSPSLINESLNLNDQVLNIMNGFPNVID